MKVVMYYWIIECVYDEVHPIAIQTADGRVWAVSEKVPLFSIGDTIHTNSSRKWWQLLSGKYVPFTSLHRFLEGIEDV